MSRLRSGVAAGKARAAARETTPRIPAQLTTKSSFQLCALPFSDRARLARGVDKWQAVDPPLQIVVDEDPHHADHHKGKANQEAEADQGEERSAFNAGQDGRELQPDQDKDEAIEDEINYVPHGSAT